MDLVLPWSQLESAFGAVSYSAPSSGRVHVGLGERAQWVSLSVERHGQGPPVVRLRSTIMGDERALQALVLALRLPMALVDELDSVDHPDGDGPFDVKQEVLLGRTLLQLLGHNDRLRGVHLHLTKGRLHAVSDLVCLSGYIDADLLVQRVLRLGRAADGMEQRMTGRDDE